MERNDRAYQIQGIDLLDLCEKYSPPVFVYDTDTIKSKINQIQGAFSQVDLKLKYAMKALSNQAILKYVKSEGLGLDTVSIQELELGIEAGFGASEILFTPNSVGFDEIKKAVEKGVRVNIDNISILEQFGNTYGNKVPVCLRINPHIQAGGNHKISTGHVDSKFGISIHQMRHLTRVVKTYDIHVEGLHMHSGSDILDSNVFIEGARILFNAAMEFPDLKYLDFGSGFKVSYKDGDVMVDIDELGDSMSKAFKEFCKEYGRDLEIWFEPGKFLVSEAGLLLVKVNVIKTTPATVFVGVDSGMNHLIRPMMYDAYHDMVNISNPGGTKRVYTVVGYICETDTLGWDRQLDEVREGDILAIRNAGAYAFSMTSNYNSRLRPAEVLIHKGKDYLIREPETLDDLLRHQVSVDF